MEDSSTFQRFNIGRLSKGRFNPDLSYESIRRPPPSIVAGLITEFVDQTLLEVVGDENVIRELQAITTAELDQAAACAKDELDKLLDDEKNHPITYNHYYTDIIQRARQQRMTRDEDYHGRMHISNTPEDVDRMMASIESRIIVDMDLQACDEALSGLQAYYNVCLLFDERLHQ